MYLPNQISTESFIGSVFENSECETILRNIVILQKSKNPHSWTPFSWDDYVEFCTHNVSLGEKRVLDTFVKGGKPASNTSANISGGWLDYVEDKYLFTDKMVSMLGEEYLLN